MVQVPARGRGPAPGHRSRRVVGAAPAPGTGTFPSGTDRPRCGLVPPRAPPGVPSLNFYEGNFNMSTKQNKAKKDDFVPNATFASRPPVSRRATEILTWFSNQVQRDAEGNITRPARTIVFQAHFGVGKTAFIKHFFEQKNVYVAYFSGAALLPPDFALTFPVLAEIAADPDATPEDIASNPAAAAEMKRVVSHAKYVLQTHLSSRLVSDREMVIFIDEMNRIAPAMMPTFMELFQSHRVAGLDIPNLMGVICARNPVGEGYIGTADGDHAFATRLIVFEIEARDIPWMEALATQWSDVDLSGVFDVWKSLDATARRVFAPRVVEHTIFCALNGLPPVLGLPIKDGRMQITTATGEDITEQVMRKVSDALGFPYRDPQNFPDLVATCIKVAYEHGKNLQMVGGAGMGKTGLVESLGPELGCEMRVVSGPNMDPSSMVMLLPDLEEGRVEPVLSSLVSEKGKKFVLVVDESRRSPKNVANQLLEVSQERSIAGVPLEGCVAVWALDNPLKDGPIQYRSGMADEAMVSRYSINIEVTVDDIDWRGHLEGIYGEDFVRPFAEWWSQDLNEDERKLIPPRVLEAMMSLWQGQLDVDSALPYVGKERVPVRTHSLKARLGNRAVLGLSAIVAEADSLLEILRDPSADEAEKAEISVAAVRAFQKADLKELEPHTDVLVDFIKALEPHNRTAVINAAQGERGDKAQKKVMFWSEVFSKTLPGATA